MRTRRSRPPLNEAEVLVVQPNDDGQGDVETAELRTVADGILLYRFEKMLSRHGIDISRHALAPAA